MVRHTTVHSSIRQRMPQITDLSMEAIMVLRRTDSTTVLHSTSKGRHPKTPIIMGLHSTTTLRLSILPMARLNTQTLNTTILTHKDRLSQRLSLSSSTLRPSLLSMVAISLLNSRITTLLKCSSNMLGVLRTSSPIQMCRLVRTLDMRVPVDPIATDLDKGSIKFLRTLNPAINTAPLITVTKANKLPSNKTEAKPSRKRWCAPIAIRQNQIPL
jgi:hypothetical protein